MEADYRIYSETNAIVIGINAINPNYTFDYLYLMNTVRYNYAKEVYPKQFGEVQKILLSNIKTSPEEKEMIVNFNRVIKRGWEHFDNAVINALRLLDKLHVQKVSLAGLMDSNTSIMKVMQMRHCRRSTRIINGMN